MRRQAIAAIAVMCGAAWASGSAIARPDADPYTLTGPASENSAWPTPGPGFTYGGGAGSVTITYKGNGAPETATLSWKMPSSISANGTKGTLTLVANAGGEVWAPGFSVSGVLVGCSGIKNTPSYGTGCAEGDHAAIGASLQPGKSASVSQDFLIKPGLGKVTVIVPGFSKQFVYQSARSSASGSNSGSSGSSAGERFSYRFSAQGGMTHDHPIVKFFGTGGFTLNHLPSGSNSTAGSSPTGSARVVLYPGSPKPLTLELAPVSVRYSEPDKHRTMEFTYKVVKSPASKCGAVGSTVVIRLVDYGNVDKLEFKQICGQAESRFHEFDADVSVSSS